MSMAWRFPIQAVGGIGGVIAIIEVMPIQYKYVLGGGPSLKVDLHARTIAEGVPIFFICLAWDWGCHCNYRSDANTIQVCAWRWSVVEGGLTCKDNC
ncbi:hypothetical protein SADUNF_Sadunf10G0058400 [Salix dunnii]|uniref:Uncharacterized protein n=1 Tax=Salix dunnii TaxID=1413687 RepID=A0A835JSK8_9ROSI|nr:hypothetical protein SADUNF_Sadunf10G0058400 [Salix dunnii]